MNPDYILSSLIIFIPTFALVWLVIIWIKDVVLSIFNTDEYILYKSYTIIKKKPYYERKKR